MDCKYLYTLNSTDLTVINHNLLKYFQIHSIEKRREEKRREEKRYIQPNGKTMNTYSQLREEIYTTKWEDNEHL